MAEQGPVRIESGDSRSPADDEDAVVIGKALLDIEADDYSDPVTLAQSKTLMRFLLSHHLSGQVLHTRRMVLDLQSLERPPTAIFAAQNLDTIGVVRALRAAAQHHEIALVGFDDVPMGDLLDPAITVLAQDPTGIGRQAATTLCARRDGDRSPTQTYVIPTKLVARGSGELAAKR